MKTINIKYGTKIIIFDSKARASQIASCYGLGGYPYLKLNPNRDDLRGISNYIKLGLKEEYPKIKIIK